MIDDNWDIFISYSSIDTKFAQKLAVSLRRRRHIQTKKTFHVFLAADTIPVGSNWYSTLEKGLTESAKIILILSPEYLASQWCCWETIAALIKDPIQLQRRVLPIKLRECNLPIGLNQLQYIDFSDQAEYGRRLKILVASIKEQVCPLKAIKVVENTKIITLEEKTPQIEIDLVFQGSGRILRCKVPSNIACSSLMGLVAKKANISMLSADDYFIEYYLYDLDRKRKLDPSKTLQESGYTKRSRISLKKRIKGRPRISLCFGGGHKKCFPEDTQILLSNGTIKAVNTIAPGEIIASFNSRQQIPAVGKVERVVKGFVVGLIRLNDNITGSCGQTILTARGWITFEDVQVGDSIFQYSLRKMILVVKKVNIGKACYVYNLVVHPFGIFIANDFLVEDQVGIPEVDNQVKTEHMIV